MTSMDDSFDLDMAAASLRADNSDVHILLKVLVDQLKDTLGTRLRVEQAGGRFRKSDAIKSVQITMGSDHFEASLAGLDVTQQVSLGAENSDADRAELRRDGRKQWSNGWL